MSYRRSVVGYGITKHIELNESSYATCRAYSSKQSHQDPDSASDSAASGKHTNDAVTRFHDAEAWQIQKQALERKFKGVHWRPRKRLSPDALDGVRALRAGNPILFTTEVLSQQFKISPEAIRRILKTSWRPSMEEQERRRSRWDKRGETITDHMTELGLRAKADVYKKQSFATSGQGKNVDSKRIVETRKMKNDASVSWTGNGSITVSEATTMPISTNEDYAWPDP